MSSLRKQPNISLDSIVVVTDDQISAHLGEELVILGYNSTRYYGLDQVGIFIWEFLQKPRKVADICRAVISEYEVKPDNCELDIIAFLEELRDNHLVVVEHKPEM